MLTPRIPCRLRFFSMKSSRARIASSRVGERTARLPAPLAHSEVGAPGQQPARARVSYTKPERAHRRLGCSAPLLHPFGNFGLDEPGQRGRAHRMLELANGLGLDLADALAGHREDLADL